MQTAPAVRGAAPASAVSATTRRVCELRRGRPTSPVGPGKGAAGTRHERPLAARSENYSLVDGDSGGGRPARCADDCMDKHRTGVSEYDLYTEE